MISQPVEITWDDDGIHVVYACDQDYVDTRQARRDYEAGR